MQTAIALTGNSGLPEDISISDDGPTIRRPRSATTRTTGTGTIQPPMSPEFQYQGQGQTRSSFQDPPSSPISNMFPRSVTFDLADGELDLSATDNYVDNHVV